MGFTSVLHIRAADARLIKKSPTMKEAPCYMESIRPPDKNPLCSKMERCKENEIVAERFKASSRQINQNLLGERCQRANGMQDVSGRTSREHNGDEEERPDKDNYSRDKCSKWRRGNRPGGGVGGWGGGKTAQRGC